uniref:Uncharacterized protein n=1 Tax=Colobus angolensis palliatus TaxID=336983 RepID=A0A2K5HLN8_COLAP
METALDWESLRPTFWSRSPVLFLHGFSQLEDNLQSLTKHPHWKNKIWFLKVLKITCNLHRDLYKMKTR